MTNGQPLQPPVPSAPPTASSPPSTIRTLLAAVAGIAALLLIVFSFFSWYSGSATTDKAGMTISMDVSVTGMGSGTADMEVANVPAGLENAINKQMAKGEQDFVDSAAEKSKKPGIWTVVLGLVVAAGAALLMIGGLSRIGALVTALGGLAATIAAIVFVSDPEGALGMKDQSSQAEDFSSGAGWGLWLVLLGALLALAAGGLAVATLARSGRASRAPAVAGAPGAYPDQPQQFGQVPPSQPGEFPPAPPQQGGYPPQPQ
ncbi:hypothetical protein [Gordonia sp. (in: high G+C Gram-positive bacteria)]|uniref:hypothetical protein n=2 Tax=Gordonia sp. (in: high G+C Gram-positive bacteria) TaxID=84139 RepID=UPI003C78D9A4